MSNIVFFSIPAHGHTNPTIQVVRALTKRGHAVRYYSFAPFREKIEDAGAQFVSCDRFMPPLPKNFEKKSKSDFSSLVGMLTHVTIQMESFILGELQGFPPDCIVSDSLCLWGKLYAKKLNVPMVCSTTSFAFNKETAKMMRPGFRQLLYTITGIFKIGKYMNALRDHGYNVDNLATLIQNDNETDTIVYTSRAFQPLSETFGDKYAFIGPSIPEVSAVSKKKGEPQIYISLGTVIQDTGFYQNCIEALRDKRCFVIMSVGHEKNIPLLRDIPEHIQVHANVPQLEVLQNTDVFVTHCGMNSVNESIYYGVPMVLAPQHAEQNTVAQRAQEVGAGIRLKHYKAKDIDLAITTILTNQTNYQENIKVITDSFRSAGGPQQAADKIEQVMHPST